MRPWSSPINLVLIVSQRGDYYESIRWPSTLGFFTVLLLLCTILVIGVARSSRCALIFFSVFGLFGVIVCWLLSGIYLAGAVAMGDFCMRPNEYMCRQFGKVVSTGWNAWWDGAMICGGTKDVDDDDDTHTTST